MAKGSFSAASVTVSTAAVQAAGAGSTPSAALHSLLVQPIPLHMAKELLVRRHYLHTLPGGTKLSFGIFLDLRLLGALTLGVGPYLAHSLVNGATPDDCVTLTRLWLSDELPRNSESRVLGVLARALRRHTSLKFLLAYADPSHGHRGTIYQGAGWVYTGLSAATPLYDVGDGVPRHSRSLAHNLGSHSIKYLSSNGVDITLVPQAAKHRYIRFVDEVWRHRLNVPVFPYPKMETKNENH